MAKERDEINRGGKIEPREITAELRESYLDYAMSVIVGRALPDVRDGLKPVHRRILWAMQELGLTAGSKFMKSARVVGETMGKFHPHGDAAVYDALVRMAQPFSLRYPLITGQGNFGSVDGDGAAAQRYTEVKLSPIAEELLTDIDKDTVDFAPNYDDSRKEPVVMPAKFPNLLVNGSEGIAVGMATKIPPHNLSEVINASIHLIDSPKATAEELMGFVQGPDFPTGGIIYDRKAIVEAYISGRGSVTCRATVEVEEKRIVISEIPYQVNKSELIIRMAELVQEKRIEGIRDLRDESDKDGLRITIDLKSDSVPEKVLNQLWRHTDLQKDYHLNMVALAEGLQPQTMSIRDVLLGFVLHRKEVVTRRTKFELKRAEERAHILEGLAKALSQIDKVIAAIKKSADRAEAHTNLIKQFDLSDRQATAILEMRLQTLAALERQKIADELKEKLQLIKDLKLLLKSPEKILGIIKRELKELDSRFGDERRTKLKVGALKELADEDMIPQEEAIITQTHDGYIKRLPPGTFKHQRRGGKGVKGGITNEADVLTHFIGAHTHDDILFFTDKGRVFQTKVYEIPSASRVSKGQMIHNFLGIPANEKVSAIVAYGSEEKKNNPYLVIVTAGGVIKKTGLDKFENVRRSGILAVNLSKGDELKWAKLAGPKDEIVMTTAAGRAIRFKGGDVRAMGRTAGGVRGITLKKDDRVSSFDLVAPMKAARFLTVMVNGYAKQTPLKEYKLQRRGGQGILTAKVTSKTGQVVSAHVIIEQTELLALSAKGLVLRTSIKSIRSAGRATQGVRIMKLGAGDKIIGTVCL
ncbi:MAG: DNA gyrase subunit A [Candidatus Colwellbacteria bacterium]|nr:DNA gyrase subunit A [Candidatus Colwellbacteria bacterium]